MADTELQGDRPAGSREEGDRSLDRARKLVALDRALIEIGEPGVLEREPADLASLEARLFGPPAGGAGAPPAGPALPGADGAAPAETAPPELRLVKGKLLERPPVDGARRAALRATLRLIQGAS